MIFQGIWTSTAKKPYRFELFRGVGEGWPPDIPVPSSYPSGSAYRTRATSVHDVSDRSEYFTEFKNAMSELLFSGIQ